MCLPERRVVIVSRRDYRTQPGVLTPGIDQKTARPEEAGDIRCTFSFATPAC
jgi:hypothetical protein